MVTKIQYVSASNEMQAFMRVLYKEIGILLDYKWCKISFKWNLASRKKGLIYQTKRWTGKIIPKGYEEQTSEIPSHNDLIQFEYDPMNNRGRMVEIDKYNLNIVLGRDPNDKNTMTKSVYNYTVEKMPENKFLVTEERGTSIFLFLDFK
jgi:hypothetical protein